MYALGGGAAGVSNDPTASDSAESGEDGDYVAALRTQLADYRQVVQNQQQRVNYLDRKAAKLSRFVLAVFGVVATGVSVFPTQFPSNGLVIVGLVALIGAFIAGVLAQSASELKTGSRARHADGLLELKPTETEWLEVLVDDYGDWVAGNQLELSKSAFYLRITQYAVIVGIVGVALGLGVRLV